MPNQPPVIFAGSSHPQLSNQIASYLGVSLGKANLCTFPDGEISVQIMENVRGRDVFVIQSIYEKPNFYLMELLIMIDALKRASANSIVAVLPYFGYSRQDRKDRPRVPITAKLVANLLETAGATRVLTMDLHADQLQGFFDIPVDNLFARPQFALTLQSWGFNNLVVVAPDVGGIRLARAFATHLGGEIAIVDKRRLAADEVEVTTVIGDVAGKTVLLTDDICSTAGTLVAAADVCVRRGATKVFAAVTHGLLVGNGLEKLEKSQIELLMISNTIPREEDFSHSKILTVSVASLFGEAITCILSARSISSLFDGKNWCQREEKHLPA